MKNNVIGGACGTYESQDRCIQGLVGRLKEWEHLGSPRRIWEDNIKNRSSRSKIWRHGLV
jgi:hypothetical protein